MFDAIVHHGRRRRGGKGTDNAFVGRQSMFGAKLVGGDAAKMRTQLIAIGQFKLGQFGRQVLRFRLVIRRDQTLKVSGKQARDEATFSNAAQHGTNGMKFGRRKVFCGRKSQKTQERKLCQNVKDAIVGDLGAPMIQAIVTGGKGLHQGTRHVAIREGQLEDLVIVVHVIFHVTQIK